MLLEPLIEECKLVVRENDEFQNLDVIIQNIFGNFGLSRIGNKENTYALNAQRSARVKTFSKTKKPVHHFLNETPVLHGFDRNLGF